MSTEKRKVRITYKFGIPKGDGEEDTWYMDTYMMSPLDPGLRQGDYVTLLSREQLDTLYGELFDVSDPDASENEESLDFLDPTAFRDAFTFGYFPNMTRDEYIWVSDVPISPEGHLRVRFVFAQLIRFGVFSKPERGIQKRIDNAWKTLRKHILKLESGPDMSRDPHDQHGEPDDDEEDNE